MDEPATPEIRKQLVVLLRRPRCCFVGRPPKAPSDWKPRTVVDPATGEPFTDDSAWAFIAGVIEQGCAVSKKIVDVPPGASCWVIKVQMTDSKTLYVKLQLGAGTVIGRSFHYSYY